MIYLQHSVAEAAPAMTETAPPAGLSSFYFSAAADAAETVSASAEETTAAALSGFS